MMNRESVQCTACRSVAREKNGAWKGGRTRSKAGYVMVRVVDHPRAANNGGYVFEHILVMEDLLGRPLVPGETVHHINGVKDDNRPENLELWTRPQPSGIRAKDAFVWALRTIALYSNAAVLMDRDASNNASSQ
jgi:hypothetical protein